MGLLLFTIYEKKISYFDKVMKNIDVAFEDMETKYMLSFCKQIIVAAMIGVAMG